MQIFDLHASKALARWREDLFGRYCYSGDFLHRESTWSERVDSRLFCVTKRYCLYLISIYQSASSSHIMIYLW